MLIPAPIVHMMIKLAISNAGSFIAAPLEKVPHIQVVAKAYEENQPLEVIIGLYLQATESLKDDEIAGRVGEVMKVLAETLPKILAEFSTRPFKDLIGDVLANITVPYLGDGEKEHINVAEIINKAFSELAK